MQRYEEGYITTRHPNRVENNINRGPIRKKRDIFHWQNTTEHTLVTRKGCDHKISYLTREDADRAVSEYNERVVLSIDPMTSYRCRKHGCFHIGHKRPLAEIKAYRKMLIEIGYRQAS